MFLDFINKINNLLDIEQFTCKISLSYVAYPNSKKISTLEKLKNISF